MRMATVDDGEYTAVVDRFEGDFAVLLLEDGDGETVDEIAVDEGRLPTEARSPDAVLTVEVASGDIASFEYLEQETMDRLERARDRFDELSERL